MNDTENDVDNRFIKTKKVFSIKIKQIKEQYLKNLSSFAELKSKYELYVISYCVYNKWFKYSV